MNFESEWWLQHSFQPSLSSVRLASPGGDITIFPPYVGFSIRSTWGFLEDIWKKHHFITNPNLLEYNPITDQSLIWF